MYKRELDIKLSKNDAMRVVFLYGADIFLMDYYGKKIMQNFLEKGAEQYNFYFDAYNFEEILGCFSQGSLFGGDAAVLIKVDKKIQKKQLDTLIEMLLKNSGYLIIEFYQAENKSDVDYSLDCKAMSGAFKGREKDGIFEVRFFATNLNDSLGILKQKAQELEIQIPDMLLKRILEQQNFDLGLSIAELQKLSIFKDQQEINGVLIESLGYNLGSVEIEEVLDLVLLKKDFLQKLEQLLEQNIDEKDLINATRKYFYLLFLCASYAKLYGNIDFKNALGYSPPIDMQKKIGNFALRFDYKKYEEIFFILNTWREESLKGINKGNRFLSTLIKIQAILR